jgi:hypothetical protein
MGLGTAIGIGIGFSRGGGQNWSSYWTTQFTGIPIKYADACKRWDNSSTKGFIDITIQPSREIINVLGTYHFFEEAEVTSVWKIYKKTGTDGLHFTQRSAALFTAGGAGTYDQKGQADPTVIYDGIGDWKMWFDAKDGADTWDYLGYATSTDGTTWTKVGKVDTLRKGGIGEWDSTTIHHPTALKYNGVYYLFYAGSDDGINTLKHIGLATSSDGLTWVKEPTNPVILKGTSPEWDYSYIRPSRPIKIYDTWYMFYWGYSLSAGKHSMGLATSPDLITWTKVGKVLENPSASTSLLIEGTNPLDKIIQIWETDYTTPTEVRFLTVTLPTTKTLLGKFIPSFIYTTAKGDVTADDTNIDGYGANYIYFSRLTNDIDFACSAISVNFHSMLKPLTGKVKCALYANGTNTPAALLGTTEERNWADIEGRQWVKFDFASPINVTSLDYWIGVVSEGVYYRAKGAGGANNWGNKAHTYANAFPNPASATTTQAFSNMDMCISLGAIEDIWQIALVTEPTKVYFNNIEGTQKASIAELTSYMDWFWDSDVLYIYSHINPNVRYQISYE